VTELAAQSCEACTGDTPVLTPQEVEALRAQIDGGWTVVDGRRLVRHLRFKDFRSAFARAAQIAEIAESEGHHPEMTIGWGHLDVELTTHAVSGLSRNDFILAAKIDSLGA
jgi:4a-hydroxytetrahydrobiopterin dehydratase